MIHEQLMASAQRWAQTASVSGPVLRWEVQARLFTVVP